MSSGCGDFDRTFDVLLTVNLGEVIVRVRRAGLSEHWPRKLELQRCLAQLGERKSAGSAGNHRETRGVP